jgi:hypothetical protein
MKQKHTSNTIENITTTNAAFDRTIVNDLAKYNMLDVPYIIVADKTIDTSMQGSQ